MPKIPESEIERMKLEVDLVALVAAGGVQLKQKGSNWVGCCPFHDDHDPSLVVTPSKNLWNCLGACQCGGDVFSWVMKLHSVDFRKAYEILREQHGGPKGTSTKGKAEVTEVSEVDRQALLNRVVDFYQESLKTSTEGQDYLEKRGLWHAEAIEAFRIGYSNRMLSSVLPSRQTVDGAKLRDQLMEIGIFRKGRGHEHFSGSVVFPVIDENGLIQELYGRKTAVALRQGTALHTYLPGPHRGIWNPNCLKEKTIILCESIIDALTFWVHGFRNVTASYGVNGFTSDHLAAFQTADVKRVLIAYDRDEAGNQAALELAKKLIPKGIACYRVLFPKGMDANAYALKVTPAKQSLGLALEKAVWLGEGEDPAETRETLPLSFLPLDAEEAPEQKISNPISPDETLAKMEGTDIIFHFGSRRYRVRGLEQNESNHQLKINLMVSEGDNFHVDMLELYATKQRSGFIHQAATELYCDQEVIRKDLAKILRKLEALQDDKEFKDKTKQCNVSLSEAEQREALQALRDPNLLKNTLKDFETCGLIGEETNKLIGHLAAISRKQADPLALIIQSSSSAGKTALMEGILAFVPEEEMEKFTSMTGKSLFYMEENNLKHKVLAIAEEEGAEDAIYPLKLLQSEKVLNIASTGKNPQTGRLGTETYRVEGPVSLILTTTAIEMDEEFQNRCFVLAVDESREQTRAIHEIQRQKETLEGMMKNIEKEAIIKRQQNMQRLLKPIYVVNPYANQLTFLDHKLRTRRDQMKYLALIRAIALLHQYQRPVKQLRIQESGSRIQDGGGDLSAQNKVSRNANQNTPKASQSAITKLDPDSWRLDPATPIPYIEATLSDIETANNLVNEILGKSLDELTPQTRKFLERLTEMVRERCKIEDMEQSAYRFNRKEIREYSGWSDYQVRMHMEKLVSMEYLIVHRGQRGQSFVYELLYKGEGEQQNKFMMSLIEVQKLRQNLQIQEIDKKFEHLNGNNEHQKSKFEPSLSIQRAPNEHPLSMAKTSLSLTPKITSEKEREKSPKKGTGSYQKTLSNDQTLGVGGKDSGARIQESGKSGRKRVNAG